MADFAPVSPKAKAFWGKMNTRNTEDEKIATLPLTATNFENATVASELSHKFGTNSQIPAVGREIGYTISNEDPKYFQGSYSETMSKSHAGTRLAETSRARSFNWADEVEDEENAKKMGITTLSFATFGTENMSVDADNEVEGVEEEEIPTNHGFESNYIEYVPPNLRARAYSNSSGENDLNDLDDVSSAGGEDDQVWIEENVTLDKGKGKAVYIALPGSPQSSYANSTASSVHSGFSDPFDLENLIPAAQRFRQEERTLGSVHSDYSDPFDLEDARPAAQRFQEERRLCRQREEQEYLFTLECLTKSLQLTDNDYEKALDLIKNQVRLLLDLQEDNDYSTCASTECGGRSRDAAIDGESSKCTKEQRKDENRRQRRMKAMMTTVQQLKEEARNLAILSIEQIRADAREFWRKKGEELVQREVEEREEEARKKTEERERRERRQNEYTEAMIEALEHRHRREQEDLEERAVRLIRHRQRQLLIEAWIEAFTWVVLRLLELLFICLLCYALCLGWEFGASNMPDWRVDWAMVADMIFGPW